MLSWLFRRCCSNPCPVADGRSQPIRRTGDSAIIHASGLPSGSCPATASEKTSVGEVRDSVSSGVLKAIAG